MKKSVQNILLSTEIVHAHALERPTGSDFPLGFPEFFLFSAVVLKP